MQLITDQIQSSMAGSSWIRKMFEKGLELKGRYGADAVCDFSLGNPDVPPPAAAKDALLDAGVNEMRQWASLRVTCPYSLYDRVRLEAEKLGAVFENTDYGADITLALLLPEEAAEPFAQTLRELSAGRLVPEKIGSVFRGVLRK